MADRIAIVDTAPIVSAANPRDPDWQRAGRALATFRGELIVAAPVTQEVDYLLGKRLGPQAQRAFLEDIIGGTFRVECLEPAEYRRVAELGERYRALQPGLADLACVILAARFETRTVFTSDQRHFRAMAPLQGGAFTLLPWDGE